MQLTLLQWLQNPEQETGVSVVPLKGLMFFKIIIKNIQTKLFCHMFQAQAVGQHWSLNPVIHALAVNQVFIPKYF